MWNILQRSYSPSVGPGEWSLAIFGHKVGYWLCNKPLYHVHFSSVTQLIKIMASVWKLQWSQCCVASTSVITRQRVMKIKSSENLLTQHTFLSMSVACQVGIWWTGFGWRGVQIKLPKNKLCDCLVRMDDVCVVWFPSCSFCLKLQCTNVSLIVYLCCLVILFFFFLQTLAYHCSVSQINPFYNDLWIGYLDITFKWQGCSSRQV